MKESKNYPFLTAILLVSFVSVQAFSVNSFLHTSKIIQQKQHRSCSLPSSSTTALQSYEDNDTVYSTPSDMMKGDQLDVKAVCQLAKRHHYKEIYLNRPSKVVAFSLKNSKNNDQYQDSSARITVYWSTGTIITCMTHPKKGQTQLVRRGVDIQTLESIFDNPRDQKGLGYPLNAKTSPDGSVFDVEALEEEAKAQLEWLNDEMGMIQKQRNEIETLIHDFEKKRHALTVKTDDEENHGDENSDENSDEKLQRADIVLSNPSQRVKTHPHSTMKESKIANTFSQTTEKEEKVQNPNDHNTSFLVNRDELRQGILHPPSLVSPQATRTNRGKFIRFRVHEAKQVEKCFNEYVISLACGGKASIFLYESGEWTYTSGLPDGLLQILHLRRGTTMPPPIYVALGSNDRYFIKFKDGSYNWVGCDDMTNFFNFNGNTTNRSIKSVAFGEDWDSYFVLFDDGGWKYNNIPYSMEILMTRIEDSIANTKELEYLDCVTLGSEGQYFVRAKSRMDSKKDFHVDFQYWFGGLTSPSAISDASIYKDRIQFVDFGDEGTYIMRYA